MGRVASKFVAPLSAADRQWLMNVWRTHHSHRTRSRAHAILLSDKGFTVKQLMETFEIDEDTAHHWINRWEREGRDGLDDRPRSGSPPKLDPDEQQHLKRLLREYPSDTRRVLEELHKVTGKRICRDTLRRFAHRFGLTWKRFRRSLKKLRNPAEFELAREELAELSERHDVSIAYFDESTFSLTGVVPYGWQPIGERTEIPLSGRRNTVHVLGIERRDGKPQLYLHSGPITGATVVSVIDAFSRKIRKTTVLVLDNAKPHTCKLFKEHESQWLKRGLIIYPLPTYSPELNAIEHLWQAVKYRLLPVDAYGGLHALIDGLVNVFGRIGSVSKMPSLAMS